VYELACGWAHGPEREKPTVLADRGPDVRTDRVPVSRTKLPTFTFCPTGPRRARLRFVSTPYRLDGSNRPVPEMPTTCAWASVGPAPCRIGKKCDRPRKTGPCHPLCVLRCRTHNVCFALYPPGHVPHGRQAVVTVSLDGREPVDAADAGEGDPPAVVEGTFLEAAWEAGHGKIWTREYEPEDAQGKWLETQHRHVEQATRLAGVALEVGESAQVARAESLGVDALRLREGQALIRKCPNLRGQGQAVVHVLKAVLAAGRSVVDRLIIAGHLAGLWGRPFRWFANNKQLIALVGT